MIEEPTPQKTPLSALGEFGLIQRLTEAISLKNTTSVLGVGDDAAVLDFGPDNEVVVTKDLLLEGVHFDLMYTPQRRRLRLTQTQQHMYLRSPTPHLGPYLQ